MVEKVKTRTDEMLLIRRLELEDIHPPRRGLRHFLERSVRLEEN
jgi:hypothetical protein